MAMTPEERAARATARREERRLAKERARIEEEKQQKPVKELVISITWVKSRTWGSNPHAEAQVHFQDGTYERRDGFTCSGCGYDKESTVIAQVFDAFLKYKLWKKPLSNFHHVQAPEKREAPYGATAGEYGGIQRRGYSEGIGTSCYYRISEFIGGTFEHVASGKTFDVFKYTDGKKKGGC